MALLRLSARAAAYAWAAPCSVLGLLLGAGMALLGAHMSVRNGILEIAGGWLGASVSRLRGPFAVSGIAFGHVVLAVSDRELAAVRAHEQVHVRQYERWGPLFIPAYLVSSLLQWVRGRRPYLDNHFEREAYGAAPTATPRPMTREDVSADRAARDI